MGRVAPGQRATPRSAGELLDLLRSGNASSRSDLVRVTGLAPSTVSARIGLLLDRGWVEEVGDDNSNGGRPARRLALRARAGMVAAAEMGSGHVRLAISDLAGTRLSTTEIPLDISPGPGLVLPALREQIEAAARAVGGPGSVRGIGIGIPAPVESRTSTVVLPGWMPGWHGADVRRLLGAAPDVRVVVGNDADMMAVAEQLRRPGTRSLLALKLGRRIGTGIIASGLLHSGASGGAGEISHTSVDGIAALACACGSPNCLDSVASGGALAQRLLEAGGPALTPAGLVDLARDGDPTATRLLREAGQQIGRVLVLVLNFFEPEVLVLGGTLSRSETLVGALQGVLYDRCMPLVTRSLQVAVSEAGADAGVRGITSLVLDGVLDPHAVDDELSA